MLVFGLFSWRRTHLPIIAFLTLIDVIAVEIKYIFITLHSTSAGQADGQDRFIKISATAIPPYKANSAALSLGVDAIKNEYNAKRIFEFDESDTLLGKKNPAFRKKTGVLIITKKRITICFFFI